MNETGLKIGNIELANPFILAPLAGITDAPVRLLASEQGAAMVYSEMVSCKGLYYRDKNTERLLKLLPGEAPAAYQLFGSEPEMLEFATKALSPRDNVSFDINMGCPVPKIVKNGEGSALMRDEGLAAELVAAAVAGANFGSTESGSGITEENRSAAMQNSRVKPVTVKMRKGFNQESINAVSLAKRLEKAGAAAIAIHGRTREEYYSGKADWDIIRVVREAVNIPVIANGDVFSGADALAIMAHTGCDLVMIARGSLGNPWIFAEANALWEALGRPSGADLAKLGEEKVRSACFELEHGQHCDLQGMSGSNSEKAKPFTYAPPTRDVRIDTMLRHLEMSIDFKGEYAAVREMRKHVGWYTKGVHGAASLRRGVNEITDAAKLREAIEFMRQV
jgi:tRNA-dihydrouridine synthase B